MNKTGLILLLSAVAVCCLAQEIEETCQTREILQQLGELATETVPDTADKTVKKLKKSMNTLYEKVETLVKPIAEQQEQINQTISALDHKVETATRPIAKKQELLNQTMTYLFQKAKQESLTNKTVTEIVEKSVEKLIGSLFENVERLIRPIAAKLEALEKPGAFPSHPAGSCKSILEYDNNSRSDYYWLRATNGSAVQVYCDMTRTCGGVTGGWTRVAQLDTTKNPRHCPYQLSLNTQHGKNLCARRQTAAGCSQVRYQTNGVAYNEVCGRVIGYQFGTTDGPANYVNQAGIDGPYIDGVSLTYDSPRQHIWSFIAAHDESGKNTPYTCYCTNRNYRGSLPASFVGTDYFCDTGSRNTYRHIFYPDDPLWDGDGCGSNSDCCTFQNPPWFYKKLGASTDNNIDMRLCRDQIAEDEDVLIEKVDIFVR